MASEREGGGIEEGHEGGVDLSLQLVSQEEEDEGRRGFVIL